MNREFKTPHTETMEDNDPVVEVYSKLADYFAKKMAEAGVRSKTIKDARKAVEETKAERARDKEAYEVQYARLEEEMRRLNAAHVQKQQALSADEEKYQKVVDENTEVQNSMISNEPPEVYKLIVRDCEPEDADMPDEQTEDDDHAHNPGDGSGMMLFTTYYKGEWQMLSKFPFEEEPCLKCMKKKEINCFTPDGVSRYKQPCAKCTEHKELKRYVAGTPRDENLPEETAPAAPAAAQGTTTEAACPKCGDRLTKKRAYGGVQTYHPCDKCGVCPGCNTKLEKKGQINGRQGYRACTKCKPQRSSGAREPPKKPEL